MLIQPRYSISSLISRIKAAELAAKRWSDLLFAVLLTVTDCLTPDSVCDGDGPHSSLVRCVAVVTGRLRMRYNSTDVV